jgi:hypothetical protein
MRTRLFGIVAGWWPELLCAALLTAVAFAGQPNDLLFAVFCALIGAAFWAMGFRHRRTPLHARVDQIGETVDEVRDILTEDNGRGSGPHRVLRLIRP